MMGRKKSQTVISVSGGNPRTQFHSESSHSGFTTSAIANPTHSTAKIAMAYVLSTLEAATFQNDGSLMIAPHAFSHIVLQNRAGGKAQGWGISSAKQRTVSAVTT